MPRVRGSRDIKEVREAHRLLMQRRRTSAGALPSNTVPASRLAIVEQANVQLQTRQATTLAQSQQSIRQVKSYKTFRKITSVI